jgi:hypothetical protein
VWYPDGCTNDYGEVRAQNRGYTTISVAVPIAVVLQAIIDSLWTTWENVENVERTVDPDKSDVA